MEFPNQSTNYLHKPFEPSKEELKDQFKAKIIEQIPVAELKLSYQKEHTKTVNQKRL